MRLVAVVTWLLVSLVVALPEARAAESDVDQLLNLLVEKGVIAREDAAAFRADLAIRKQEEREQQKEFAALAGKPIKLSGYTQLRYRLDNNVNDTFDIRRGRLDLKGAVTEQVAYRLQTDFGGSSAKLLDATLGYTFKSWLKLTAGQFKIPFSQENLASSPKLETINRSQVVEALVARGKDVIGNQNGRDIGLQVSGSFWPWRDADLVEFAVGVFNGAGINALDTNEQKDLAGRLALRPSKTLSIGGSFYTGRFTPKSAPTGERNRSGAEFAYVRDPLSLKGEYIRGDDGATTKSGAYLQARYLITPKKFQGVLKFDTFDPGTAAGRINVYTVGGNWYANRWTLVQVNYELRDERREELSDNVLIAQSTLQF